MRAECQYSEQLLSALLRVHHGCGFHDHRTHGTLTGACLVNARISTTCSPLGNAPGIVAVRGWERVLRCHNVAVNAVRDCSYRFQLSTEQFELNGPTSLKLRSVSRRAHASNTDAAYSCRNGFRVS